MTLDVKTDLGQAFKEVRDSVTHWPLWAFLSGCSLVFLLLPSKAVAVLGMTHLRDQLRPWIGLTAIVSVVGLALSIGVGIGRAWSERSRRKALIRTLGLLSPPEKALLWLYISGGTKTQYIDPQNGVVMGLARTGVLYIPSQSFNVLVGVAVNMNEWAWQHLRKHPELLKLTPAEQRELQQQNEAAKERGRW